MYLLILLFETMNKLKLSFECGISMPQDAETPLLLLRASDAGLQKRATFSALIVGPSGTGVRTQTTCIAGSGANRSAIHYNLGMMYTNNLHINGRVWFSQQTYY
jgi:hypothetical protein